MNIRLQNQIEELGAEASPEDRVEEDEVEEESEGEKAWEDIQADIDSLKKLIDGAKAPSNQYARFLFPAHAG